MVRCACAVSHQCGSMVFVVSSLHELLHSEAALKFSLLLYVHCMFCRVGLHVERGIALEALKIEEMR